MLEPSGLITICDKFIHLLLRQPKSKTLGKAIFIALDGLIHHARFNSIKCGKIPIDHHLYASNREYVVTNRPPAFKGRNGIFSYGKVTFHFHIISLPPFCRCARRLLAFAVFPSFRRRLAD